MCASIFFFFLAGLLNNVRVFVHIKKDND